jgi:hypothetical protein
MEDRLSLEFGESEIARELGFVRESEGCEME